MKKILLIIAIVAIFAACKNTNLMKIVYPKAKTVDSSTNFFGTIVKDPYRWMENSSDTDIQKWIDEENMLTQNYLKQIPYRNEIYNQLKEIYNYQRVGSPFKEGGKYFFYKNDGLQNQAVIYIMDSLNAEPRILIDPNKLSTDGTIALAGIGFSKDGKYFGYATAASGSDWNEIFVIDLKTNQLISDHIQWVKFSGISFYKDGFYYSRFDEPKKGTELTTANENQKVYYHLIGTDQSADKLVYADPKVPTHGFGASVSDDEQFLIVYETVGTSGTVIHYKDLTKTNSQFVTLNDNFDSDFSFVDHINGKLYFLTNFEAPNYQLLAVEPNKPDLNNYVKIIPESKDVIENIAVSKNYFIADYMQDVKNILKVYDFNGKFIKDIQLPGIGSVAGVNANKTDNFVFYQFSSYTTPGTILKYDFTKNESSTYYQSKFKGVDLSQFVVEQVFYPSKDGTKIPMFIVHKKDIKLDGNNPTWLYGYGGFNISLNPTFDVRRLLWLENGGVYAVANLRGGGEYGENWHKQGTKMNKQNVFDDFISAAQYLINQKYTNPSKLAVQGGSNGGLLIGAVVNQRPDLFKVALPAVGVMDMLRYYLFTIGRAWSSDYGLPTDSKEMFAYLNKYSPLENVDSTKTYPAVLVTTADHDDRVVPAHSFKYTATLQAKLANNPNPLLIRIDSKAGHGGGKPTEKILEEWADLYAFTFFNMGIEPKNTSNQ